MNRFYYEVQKADINTAFESVLGVDDLHNLMGFEYSPIHAIAKRTESVFGATNAVVQYALDSASKEAMHLDASDLVTIRANAVKTYSGEDQFLVAAAQAAFNGNHVAAVSLAAAAVETSARIMGRDPLTEVRGLIETLRDAYFAVMEF